MPRQRVIVSIGEALVSERGDQVEAGGLAFAYAAAAASARSGLRCAAVSRIGQDAAGDEWLRQARERSIDVAHVQSDPDLPTGRRVTRNIAGQLTSTLTANAAFDNLQWDFDMIDLAQRTDAVIFGQLARRGGQTRSVIKQFLLECGSERSAGALRVFDLTNRASEKLDRNEASAGLEFCDVMVADDAALKALVPAMAGGAGTASDSGVIAAAREVLRTSTVQVVLHVARSGERARMQAVSRDKASDQSAEFAWAMREAAIVGTLLALLDGSGLDECVRAAGAVE